MVLLARRAILPALSTAPGPAQRVARLSEAEEASTRRARASFRHRKIRRRARSGGGGRGRLVQWVTVKWVFDGEVIEWRGPAPYFFVAMSASDSAELKDEARSLIYWGQVPVHVVVGATEFTTALFPKDGRYLVPLKDAVRKAEGIGEGDVVAVVVSPARRTDVPR